jgi:hypothetical protein
VFVGDRVAVFVGDRVAVFGGDRVAVHVIAILVRVIVAVLLGSHGNGIDVVGSAVITA